MKTVVPSHSRREFSGLSALPRRTAIAAAVTACFVTSGALANPTGLSVANGSASASGSGTALTITNSPGAILNWQSFSIGQGELTRFLQQNAASSVLNRVVGANPSAILGTLQSNGRVFLINPNGITFGAGSVIDVAGLVASTLNLSNQDFLAGRQRFSATPGAGDIVNQGAITTAPGGQIYLIAPNVQNNGILRSPQGEVILAAGASVELVNAGSPELRVEINAAGNQALNLGQIIAESGKLGIYAGLIKNSGSLNADSASLEGGRIVLKASKDLTLDPTSTLSANGTRGGSITLQAGDTTLVAGQIEATGRQGQGGTLQLLGDRVGLTQATADVSGSAGGGTLLVGGDTQGKNPEVQNASRTYVGSDVTLKADATEQGDGGKIIVWADEFTRFYGAASVTGGGRAGDGGFVEISGKQSLDFRGRVDATAAHGARGSILFDPNDIVIAGSGTDDGQVSDATVNFADGGAANFTIGEDALEALTGNVLLQATRDITVNPGLIGGLMFTQPGQAIEMEAGRNLIVNSPITTNGGLIRLWAGQGPSPSPTAALTVNANLTSGVGRIYLASSGSGGLTVGSGVGITGNEEVYLQADAVSLGAAALIRGVNVSIWPWNYNDISVGSTGSGLRVTQADLNVLRTDPAGLLYIGDYLQTNNITITSPVTFSATNTPNVVLFAGNGSISQGAGATITADALAAYSEYGGVDLSSASNQVNTIAGIAGGGDFRFSNASSLTVGSVGGVDGITADGAEGSGTVTINVAVSAGSLTVTQPIVAYAPDGGEGYGGNASISLFASGGVVIDGPAGGSVAAYGFGGYNGGSAAIVLNGGNGGISIDGGEGATIQAMAAYGDTDGGSALISLTASGASSIVVNNTDIQAFGGDGSAGNGGDATIGVVAGTGGVNLLSGSITATGGTGNYRGAGVIALTTAGPISLDGNLTTGGDSGGISLTAGQINSGLGVLATDFGQNIDLTATGAIGSEGAPVLIQNGNAFVQAASGADVYLAQIDDDLFTDGYSVTSNTSGTLVSLTAQNGNLIVSSPFSNPNAGITLRSEMTDGAIIIDGSGGSGSVTSGGGRDISLFADDMDVTGDVRSASGFVIVNVNSQGRDMARVWRLRTGAARVVERRAQPPDRPQWKRRRSAHRRHQRDR